MHDPDVVLFQIRRPWPTVRRLRYKATSGVSLPYVRYLGFEAYFPSVVTVWHSEPRGADSGTVCKDGRGLGSALSWKTLRFTIRHRDHVRLQVSPWQQLCRRIWTRCQECGEPFRRKQSVTSHSWGNGGPGWRSPEQGVFHSKCSALVTTRSKSAERLAVLELICDVWGISGSDVQELAPMRWTDMPSHDAWNRAWRVMYDLKKSDPKVHL